jgi:hypothetical protein
VTVPGDCAPSPNKKQKGFDGCAVQRKPTDEHASTNDALAALAWAAGFSSNKQGEFPRYVHNWMDDITPEELADILIGHEAAQMTSESKHRGETATKQTSRRNVGSRVSYRNAVGKRLQEFLDTEEGRAAIKARLQWNRAAVHLDMHDGKNPVSKNCKMFLRRCASMLCVRTL